MNYVTLPIANGPADVGQAASAPPEGMVDAATWQRTQSDLMRMQELLAQVGRELAEPLTAALERVNALVTTGRIDRSGLKMLLAEVDRARQAGIWCQQISRLSSGRARQSHERVHLSNTVQSVLAHRSRELQSRGIQVTQAMSPVEVQADASLLFSLLNALVDWCLVCAHGTVDVRVDIKTWPAHGQLELRMRHCPADLANGLPDPDLPMALNGLTWHLLDQVALTMGLKVEREIDATHARLMLEFPHTINPMLAEIDAADDAADQGFATSVNSKPLAGSHVLVVAARRDLRLLVRESVKSMGLVVDFVSSVSEAARFCTEALPHAIIFESNLSGQRFDQLVAGIRKEVPEFVLVEVLEEGDTFDISSVSPTGVARVGREAILTSLPSALVYELARTM
jgi:CheY-like chemotaxis protein